MTKIGRTIQLALAVTGLVVATTAAVADETSQIIVEAPRAVQKTTQTGPMGQRIPAISLVYRVSYSDLDIATHSGALELEKRIKDAAKNACAEIVKLYPLSSEGDPPCVQGAIKSGMVRAGEAIATAEKTAHK